MKGLKITPASFEEALELNDSVSEALAERDININPDVFSGDIDGKSIGSIFKIVLSLSKSKRVRIALFACAERAAYKDQRVDADFFEEVKNRPLYYPIMLEVLKVNLGPFFENLIGSFQNLDLAGIVKQKSPQ